MTSETPSTGNPIIKIEHLAKRYSDGFEALKDINLTINKGEIIALLGPNGAGKTTLISVICGIVNASAGSVNVAGYDIIKDYRAARKMIGLVPQELTTDSFESVLGAVEFSRGLFGKKPDAAYLEKILRSLSLWDKKDNKIMTLSGGMKRRLLIAKALSHQPQILFLDEPTAGVDVELRKDMWQVVRGLQQSGVTIILTTHYIDEAEEMADRIAVINGGEIMLVEQKQQLMDKLGEKRLVLHLVEALTEISTELSAYPLELQAGGYDLVYSYDVNSEHSGITTLLDDLEKLGIHYKDLETRQSSLEEIFVNLVKKQ